MEIRDPVHGSIQIISEEIPIIQSPFFQRLRSIKQLGFSEYVFPGATHTRFLHSIGVLSIAEKVFNKIFHNHAGFNQRDLLRIKETFKLAALLHDIGHAPLSHSTEMVMPKLKELLIPKDCMQLRDANSARQATHEDYTIKAIVDSSFSSSFKKVEEKFGVQKKAIAQLIAGHGEDHSYFTLDSINYFPLLHQLISSEMDCDRMDYLLRDSYFCGVSYGHFDLDWIIDNLTICAIDKKAYLGISERALSTFDDFLLGRYHMFLMVYFHYRPVCLEQLLGRYFQSSPGEYSIPPHIEDYQRHDDYYLMEILRSSQNRYAKMIVQNSIPEKIYECYGEDGTCVLEKLENYIKSIGHEYILCSSSGRLSKYYNSGDLGQSQFPIKVVRKLHGPTELFYKDIEKATDLFQKFSKTHTISRLYCDVNQFSSEEKSKIIDIIRTEELRSLQ